MLNKLWWPIYIIGVPIFFITTIIYKPIGPIETALDLVVFSIFHLIMAFIWPISLPAVLVVQLVMFLESIKL